MANKVANTIYAIFKREEWEKVANIYSHNGYANQSYKEGDVVLGNISNAQVVINTMDVTRVSKVFGSTVEHVVKKTSGPLDLIYVAIKVVRYSTDGKQLTTFDNQLELSDGLSILSGGVALAGAAGVAIATPIALGLAVAGAAYYIYQSKDENEKITFDKFIHGYERTAMDAFINANWDPEDKGTYHLLNVSQGGAQTLRWVISAIENLKSVNPDHDFITQITPNNYGKKSLDYVYSEGLYENIKGLRGNNGDAILNEYHIKFIYSYPDAILRDMKDWEKNGEDDKVSAHLATRENLFKNSG